MMASLTCANIKLSINLTGALIPNCVIRVSLKIEGRLLIHLGISIDE